MQDDAPTAAVLIIGDEILSGRTQDTNLNAIARFVGAYGIDVVEARVVGDRQEAIVEALNELRERATYVFTTGGIGPTHDDITAEAVAAAFRVPLIEHPEAFAILHDHYGDELNEARRRMTRTPEGASLIANPVSKAPGFQVGNVFVLAGVPGIMRAMLEDVGPRLRAGVAVTARTLRVEGVGEGVIAAPLSEVARAFRDLSLGSYPFYSPERFGSSLVVRGRDAARVGEAVAALTEALRGVSAEPVEVEGG